MVLSGIGLNLDDFDNVLKLTKFAYVVCIIKLPMCLSQYSYEFFMYSKLRKILSHHKAKIVRI